MRWWGAGRVAGSGARSQDAAAATELGEVRGDVRACSGGMVTWAAADGKVMRTAGSGGGARRGRAGAKEPHAVGGELRTSSIRLG